MIPSLRPSRSGRAVAAAVVTAAAFAVGACGDDDGAGTDAGSVIATTTIWADIASNVGCDVGVPAIIPPGVDAHTFEPSLRDRARLEAASAVVANGSGLEASLTDLLATVAAAGTPVVEMTDHVDVLATHNDDENENDDDDNDNDVTADTDLDAGADTDGGHAHADGDPHVWLDPLRVAGTLDVLVDVMAAAPDADLAAVRECADTYRTELEQLDAEIAELLAPIPTERRVLVTGHDAFEYFADRYDFEVIGTVIPSTSTIAETSAAALAGISDVIAEHDVPAIFTDSLESDADADALAARLGIETVPLHTGALTADGPASTYIGMMRANAEAIAAALVGP